jgi:hypothetical protein
MNEDKKILLIIATIPIVAILMIFLISKVTFDLSLSSMEKKLFNFNYENIPKITERASTQIYALKNPIAISKSSPRLEFPETPLAELSPPSAPAGKRVSMILVNKNRKIAIIDGKVFNEGDIIEKHRIARIEKDKVLLINKEGETWLKLE